jgi:hypothetical protein
VRKKIFCSGLTRAAKGPLSFVLFEPHSPQFQLGFNSQDSSRGHLYLHGLSDMTTLEDKLLSGADGTIERERDNCKASKAYQCLYMNNL